jgi:hypothetical protein
MKAALLVLAVACATLVGASHASARQEKCTPGADNTQRTFCGPAKATFHVNGKKHLFNQGGNCSTDASTWSLNIGTTTIQGKPKHAGLSITVFSKKPGKHGAAVTWQFPKGQGKSGSLLNAKVTLAKGLKKGAFTGQSTTGGKGYGSFTCR